MIVFSFVLYFCLIFVIFEPAFGVCSAKILLKIYNQQACLSYVIQCSYRLLMPEIQKHPKSGLVFVWILNDKLILAKCLVQPFEI